MLHSIPQDLTPLTQILTPLQTAVHSKILDFLSGTTDLPYWSPSEYLAYDAEYLKPLQALKLHATLSGGSHVINKNVPNLLLHDLGKISQRSEMHKRLQDIFQPGEHTLFVNTSGSGKTRIALEGLCQSWGLYFTCQQPDPMLGTFPSIGTCDLSVILHRSIPKADGFTTQLESPFHSSGREWNTEELTDIHQKLSRNWEIAEYWFTSVLLARFAVLDWFLTIAISLGITPGSARQKWLLLQIQPFPILREDIFHSLTQEIGQSSIDIHLLSKALRLYWSRASSQLPDLEPQLSSPHLFLVIDEAQDGAQKLRSAFRSGPSAEFQYPYEERQERPILRQLVHVFSHIVADQKERDLTCSGTFIVTGTGISAEMLREATSSITYKPITFSAVFRTGGFDTKNSQEEYVRKYLGDFVDTNQGKELVERLWIWLRGRYRFTAEFVALFLSVNGFQSPQTCLNDYIESFASFRASDGNFDEPDTGRTIRTSYLPLDFGKLTRNLEALEEIKRIVYRYLLRSADNFILSAQHSELLEYGFARYLTSKSAGASVTEPLVLLAAAIKLNVGLYTLFGYLWSGIQGHESTPPWNGFENILVYYFAKCFAEPRKLGDVFSFYGDDAKLASCKATLVSLFRNPRSGTLEEYKVRMFDSRGTLEPPYIRLPGALGENAPTYDSFHWLQNSSRSAFCFPPQNMGPDIMFVLKLEGAGQHPGYIWVSVQAKLRRASNLQYTSMNTVLKGIESVTPKRYFLFSADDTDDPKDKKSNLINIAKKEATLTSLDSLDNRVKGIAGMHSVLRVVASFPQITDLTRVRMLATIDPDDEDGHPLAVMKIDHFMHELMHERNQHQVLQRMFDNDTADREKKKKVLEGFRPLNKDIKRRLSAPSFRQWNMKELHSRISTSRCKLGDVQDQIDCWRWTNKYYWIPLRSWRTKDEGVLREFLTDLIARRYVPATPDKQERRRNIINDLLMETKGSGKTARTREQRKEDLENFLDWDPEDDEPSIDDDGTVNDLGDTEHDREMMDLDEDSVAEKDDVSMETPEQWEADVEMEGGRASKRRRRNRR